MFCPFVRLFARLVGRLVPLFFSPTSLAHLHSRCKCKNQSSFTVAGFGFNLLNPWCKTELIYTFKRKKKPYHFRRKIFSVPVSDAALFFSTSSVWCLALSWFAKIGSRQLKMNATPEWRTERKKMKHRRTKEPNSFKGSICLFAQNKNKKNGLFCVC